MKKIFPIIITCIMLTGCQHYRDYNCPFFDDECVHKTMREKIKPAIEENRCAYWDFVNVWYDPKTKEIKTHNGGGSIGAENDLRDTSQSSCIKQNGGDKIAYCRGVAWDFASNLADYCAATGKMTKAQENKFWKTAASKNSWLLP